MKKENHVVVVNLIDPDLDQQHPGAREATAKLEA
jgi:hypothetical protein